MLPSLEERDWRATSIFLAQARVGAGERLTACVVIAYPDLGLAKGDTKRDFDRERAPAFGKASRGVKIIAQCSIAVWR